MKNLTIIKTMELLEEKLATPFEIEIFTIFQNKCNEYNTIQEVLEAYKNNEFSCNSGSISELTYYYQTNEIFKNNFYEIFQLLEEYQHNFGKMEIELNYNKMVWLTFEILANYFINQIENLLENKEIKTYEIGENEVINICNVLGLNLDEFEE